MTSTLANLAGGLGLFLLGMSMMTEGLKLAAGPSLERLLAGATRTRWHALGSGVLITALVQSSSAVTVAAIGFVNAGLLGLSGALWVLFGANVGTTMTGWIVALIGLKLKIEALALPLIGIGAATRLSGLGKRRGAFGGALAGFGLLFLGIALLQQSFTGLATQISLPQGEDALAVVAQLGIGILLTILMQSSSASMTIALTAAQGGLLTAQGAAAVVIGANVGTTVTAMLAAIGATPNARRASAAHVIFNALTGTVALLLLPWLVSAIAAGRKALGLPGDPATSLALFHTVFNLLGVLLMWPFADALSRWLQRRFRARESDEGAPRFLDDTVLAVPALAVEALHREIERIGAISRRILHRALDGADTATLTADLTATERLAAAAQAFIERMNLATMSEDSAERVASALRTLRDHESVVEQVAIAAALSQHEPLPSGTASAYAAFSGNGHALIETVATTDASAETTGLPDLVSTVNQAYETLKTHLLADGSTGAIRLAPMERALRRYSALRRALIKMEDARRRSAGAAAPVETPETRPP